VDDTILQGIPTIKEAKAFKQILNDFVTAAGIEVSLNNQKFSFLALTLLFKETLPEF